MSVRKKVILKDIAEQLDVSVVTVSNALAGRRGVGQEMRKKIIDLAGEMGYESAYNMSGNDRTIRIGVFTPQKARFELSPVFLALGKQTTVFRTINLTGTLYLARSLRHCLIISAQRPVCRY